MSIRKVAMNRSLMAALALTGVVALGVDMADAQASRGRSTGSRGTNTFNAPPATNTAPKAQPIQHEALFPATKAGG